MSDAGGTTDTIAVVELHRPTVQLMPAVAGRALTFAIFTAGFVVLQGWQWWIGALLVLYAVLLAVEVRRERRYALRLDADGLRECMPNGAPRYLFGARTWSLRWDEITAVDVIEGRWATTVEIAARSLFYNPTIPRTSRWLPDPDFDAKVEQIRRHWLEHRGANPPPPPARPDADRPGTAP